MILACQVSSSLLLLTGTHHMFILFYFVSFHDMLSYLAYSAVLDHYTREGDIHTALRRFPYHKKFEQYQLLLEAHVQAKFQHMISESGLRLIMFIHTRLLNL